MGQFAMTFESTARSRVSQRICQSIKDQIASGVLDPGGRVPSTRALAVEWGVSRTTVTAAYDQLIAEGYLEARQGAATRVARDLAASPPSTDRRPPVADPAGALRLRAALQGYPWRARALRCAPDQVIVVNGSQQGIDLCARLLLDPGDRALMENPGYNLARQAFVAAGAEVIPIAVDQEGMRTGSLPPARLAYTTPSHQFPLGSVMSAPRRRSLLAWAERSSAHVIEDDYDSEYRFDIAPIPAMQALDGGERVIYLGTVSKTLSPTLRLGYLVVPQALASAFAKAKRLTDRHTTGLEQEALAELIESGAYERHVRRVRRRNGERRAVLLAALTETFGAAATVVGAEAGLHVVVWLNTVPRAREQQLIAKTYEAGLGIYPVSPLHDPATPARALPAKVGLVMGYACLSEDAIRRGVRLLRTIVQAVGSRS
jgi:GntR family transcriptional regulator/MocR family aminotransferase